MPTPAIPPAIAQTLDRGLQILEAVAGAREPMTVAEAAAGIGVDRTIAHRLIATLTARGYLHRDGTGGYQLGPTFAALSSAIPDLRTIVRPHLEKLARETAETVHLVVLSGREVVFIDSIESPHALRVASRQGRRLPAHATSVGKAWLAALPPASVERLFGHTELLAVTDHTLTDRDALLDELAQIRTRGYATSQGESESGVGSIGVAVCGKDGAPRAAISVALPLNRWTDGVEDQTAEALQSVAASLRDQL